MVLFVVTWSKWYNFNFYKIVYTFTSIYKNNLIFIFSEDYVNKNLLKLKDYKTYFKIYKYKSFFEGKDKMEWYMIRDESLYFSLVKVNSLFSN